MINNFAEVSDTQSAFFSAFDWLSWVLKTSEYEVEELLDGVLADRRTHVYQDLLKLGHV